MDKQDQLKSMLRRELSQSAEKAVQSDGDIEEQPLVRLERLARLIELIETATPRRRKRWPLVVALVGTLSLVSLLAFMRVEQVEIEMDVTGGAVEFILSDQQAVTDFMNLKSIGLTGLTHLDSLSDHQGLQDTAASDGEMSVYIAARAGAGQEGVISLDAITLPAQSRVKVEPQESSYRLTIAEASFTIPLAVRGPIELSVSNAPPIEQTFERPKSILLRSGQSQADLDLTFAASKPVSLGSQLPVSGLAFERVEQFQTGSDILVERDSTIYSGMIYNESVGGTSYVLREGEALRFEQSKGVLRSMELNNQRVRLQFRGTVRGMTTGWSGAKRSLMPTYLEWLNARHGLLLGWGATLYVFGLIAGLLRWWGVRV
jgi:hypothetical protein